MDILSSKEGTTTSYRLVSRTFELPELKLLVDSVQSSKFITRQKKSEALIRKLESLVSVHEAGQLQRQVYVDGRTGQKHEREHLLQRGHSACRHPSGTSDSVSV